MYIFATKTTVLRPILRLFFRLTPEDSNISCGQTLKEKGRRKHKVFSDIFQNEVALTRYI